MTSKKLTRVLALSTLLGCSANSDFNRGYVESPVPSVQEQKLIEQYTPSVFQQIPNDVFYNKKVSLMYATGPMGGGPTGNDNLYSRPTPINKEIFESVSRELEGRGAYVLPHGVFQGDFSRDLALSRSPNMNLADVVVIADENPNLTGNLRNVYFVRREGKGYSFVGAGND